MDEGKIKFLSDDLLSFKNLMFDHQEKTYDILFENNVFKFNCILRKNRKKYEKNKEEKFVIGYGQTKQPFTKEGAVKAIKFIIEGNK